MQAQKLEVSGVISLADLVRYQYYHSHRRIWPLLLIVIPVCAVAIPASLVFLLMSAGTDDFQKYLSNTGPFLAIVSLWLVLIVGLPYRNARAAYRNQTTLREPVSYSFSTEGYAASGASYSGQIAWSAMHRIRETKSLFLLYQAPNLATVLPKRFFKTPAEIEQWRALVRAAFPNGISSPGIPGKFC